MAKGVLTVITDKPRAREIVRASLERLGYRVVTFADAREAAAYVEADLHLLDCGASRDLGRDVHRLEESAPVLILMPPGAQVVPAFGQASAGFISMAARAEEYALRLEIARPSTPEDGYRVRAERNGHRPVRLGADEGGTTTGEIAPASPPPHPTDAAGEGPREQDPLTAPPRANGHHTNRGVAVVADHDRDARRLVAFKLRRLGFEPIEVADGAEALAELGRTAPTLVVLADDLQGVGGVEVLEQLRAGGGDDQPAAIVVTAESTAELAEASERLDAAPLAKPFRLDDLGACVDRAAGAKNGSEYLSHTPGSEEMA